MTKVRECNEAASGDKAATKESHNKQSINTNKMKQLVLVANNQRRFDFLNSNKLILNLKYKY